MRVGLVTTTINVPTVLRLYRKYGPYVHFFVVGDRKSPDMAIVDLLDDLGAHSYLGIDYQHRLYRCSTLIPENCIQRRNIATIAAYHAGCDIIISIDDDNIPLSPAYFEEMELALSDTFDGIGVSDANEWFDVGQLLNPKAPHRGMPPHTGLDPIFESVLDKKVGVCAGACLGDPDISAVTRIAHGPIVHGVSAILQGGVVVDPHVKTVFNSQNTGFIRELAPAFFMFPGVGRYDDIYASLVMQRIMRERDLCVRFGWPFVWQQRNQHDLLKDLKAEIDGMINIYKVARILDETPLPKGASSIEQTRELFKALLAVLPPKAIDAGMAFLQDLEGV